MRHVMGAIITLGLWTLDVRADSCLAAAQPAWQSKPKSESLRRLTDSEIIHYMGDGKQAEDLRHESGIKTHVPSSFWTMEAKPLALAIANANRTEAHKLEYPLEFDEPCEKAPPPAGPVPPAVCSIAFSGLSSRCYFAIDNHFLIRCDPHGSYVAYARTLFGAGQYSSIEAETRYDLRYMNIAYEDARQVAHTLWWLERLRCSAESKGSGDNKITSTIGEDGELVFRVRGKPLTYSTADGTGDLVFSTSRQRVFSAKGTLWADNVADRWDWIFDDDVLLNLAQHIIAVVLPARMGSRWSQMKPSYPTPHAALFGHRGDPVAIAKTRELHRECALRFLSLHESGQEFPVGAVASVAAGAAGDLLLEDTLPRLDSLSKLPSAPNPVKSTGEFDDRSGPSRRPNSAAFNSDQLRNEARLAARKIRSANDVAALEEWAVSDDAGAGWATQRLKSLNTDRYVVVLEKRLSDSDGNRAREMFHAIKAVSPARALKLARRLPPNRKGPLTVPAFALLHESGALWDEPKYVEGLIQVMLDPESGWMQRKLAIDYLVPDDEPNRYPDPRIDKSLIRLLEPALADTTVNFTLTRASWALVRRCGAAHFDRILTLFRKSGFSSTQNDLLAQLAFMVQVGEPAQRDVLANELRQHLRRTDRMLNEIIFAAWSADLRDLKDAMARIATTSPEEIESNRGNMWGGGVRPVDDRFHLARQVVAMWDEPDPVVRAKLVIAFAYHHATEVTDSQRPERVIRMERELGQLAKSLCADERSKVRAFVDVAKKTAKNRNSITAMIETALRASESPDD